MFDYDNLINDPAYIFYGTEAVITSVVSPSLGPITVTAINKTGSADLVIDFDRDHQHAGMHTTLPLALVRKAEIEAKGLTRADLRKAGFTMNGQSYQIGAAMPRHNPTGAAEYVLTLLESE